jgi:hypothetical protein
LIRNGRGLFLHNWQKGFQRSGGRASRETVSSSIKYNIPSIGIERKQSPCISEENYGNENRKLSIFMEGEKGSR